MLTGWQLVTNIDTIPSPALLMYHERVAENIRRMISMAGGTDNLRPHVKTHKCADVLKMQLAAGINKFKCATIAEAEMAAAAGAPDVLLAYQPVGPNVARFAELLEAFSGKTRFACIVDNAHSIKELTQIATLKTGRIHVYLDIDCGQRRTGIPPGPEAFALYKLITSLQALEACGLHAYDGHIHDEIVSLRKVRCQEAFAPVEAFRKELLSHGMNALHIVAGGTPTFPFHAQRELVECSPGTNVFWDAGYAKHFPDLDFLPAVLVLARVASKPGGKRLCLDLGHKAIASESPHPRVFFPELINATVAAHNEEHLVLEADNAANLPIGAPLYGVPWHVCPTVALHQELVVVKNGAAVERWKVGARDRRVTI